MQIDNTSHDAVTLVELGLLSKGFHFLTGEISEENINRAIQWITYENLQDSDRNNLLTLFINSQGGDLYQALALIDIMNNSNKPIRTVAIGSIMSAAFLIFVSGFKGHRAISENCGIMCHQFSESVDYLKFHDLKSGMIEAENCNQRMLNVLKNATGMNATQIKSKILKESDVYLTAQEMIPLHLADSILENKR